MKDFLAYLDEGAAFWTEEGRRLAADDRRDESNLTKIRVNIYGICKSVLTVLDREKGAARIADLQKSWEKALKEAGIHDDAEMILIEEIKLETLREIRTKLCEV